MMLIASGNFLSHGQGSIGMTDQDEGTRWRALVSYYIKCIERESSLSEFPSRSAKGSRYQFPSLTEELLLSGLAEAIQLTPGLKVLAEAAQVKGDSLLYGYPLFLFESLQQLANGRTRTKREIAPLFVLELALPPLGRPVPNEVRPVGDPSLHPEVASRFGYKAEGVSASSGISTT